MPFADSIDPVPRTLTTAEFQLRPISVEDTELDYAAVMETREYLRLWQQSTWPADDFTVEANRHDLAGLEQRHGTRHAFTYTVLDPDGTTCLGCVYVFPTTAAFLARSTDEWKLANTVYVTSQPFTQQVDLLRRTDLRLRFKITEPGTPAERLGFG